MANEEAEEVVEPQEEESQPVEETTQNEPSETEDNVSEDDQNTSEESDRGDIRIALKQERERRQQLEQSLSDPNFIYSQARQLGLTEEQAQQQVEAVQAAPQSSAPSQPDVRSQVRYEINMEKTLDKYPQLAKNKDDQILVSALIDSGLSPMKAAEKFYSRFEQTKEEAKTEGATQAKQEISNRERANTASTGNTTNQSNAEMEDIRSRMKSYDRRTQEKATIEWLKLKNK